MTTLADTLKKISDDIKNSVNTSLPARIVNIYEDGYVGVVAIRNDEIEDCVVKVPVIRQETNRAYITMALKVGDRGHLKFFDRSVEEYRKTGSENATDDERVHSLSDGAFCFGFYPDVEKFVFPEGEIVLGLKNNTFTLSVDENGNLTITSPAIKIKGSVEIEGNTSIVGNLTASGTITGQTDVVSGTISGKTHTHGGVSSGGSSTGVPQ